MNIGVKQGSLTEAQCDALIVNLFEGVKRPGGGTGAVDQALGGAISKQIADEEFEGKLGECMIVRPTTDFPAKKIIVVGLGKSEDFGVLEIMKAAAGAIRKCKHIKARKVASIVHGAGIAGLPAFVCARATALGTILGGYEFIRFKTEDVKNNAIDSLDVVELSSDKIADIERGIERARLIGDAVTLTRDLVNEPSNVVTPSYLADLAQSIAKDYGMKCKVMDRKEFEEAGMGLYAAVAKGAVVEPKFIELKYEHPEATKTIALIGKGITFDTGGYSLKNTDSMYRMKDDMSGAGAVLAAMRAAGKIKPKVNILALVAATENAIGPVAIHPGDVVKSFGGKTVEINNTDAEGRLTLGDAVAYANSAGVDEIIDLATLTGACVTALGREISGILGTDQELINTLMSLGKSCGEIMWQLPLHKDYKEHLKSDIADLKNTESGGPGAILGALFVHAFVGETPWAHIDLSSTMIDKDVPLAKQGAVGIGAGTLVEYLMSYA
jgi:leucyl aminopeptidase